VVGEALVQRRGQVVRQRRERDAGGLRQVRQQLALAARVRQGHQPGARRPPGLAEHLQVLQPVGVVMIISSSYNHRSALIQGEEAA